MSQAQTNPGRRFAYFVFLPILILIVAALMIKPVMKNIYPLKFENFIEKYSSKYNIDKHLIMAVISAESKFDSEAVSHKNAKGLMQLKDETAKWCMEKFDIEDTGNPVELNISIGCSYINYLFDKFGSNTATVLAAYNAGEGNVSEWLENEGNPIDHSLKTIPFDETRKYVKKVINRQKIYRFLY